MPNPNGDALSNAQEFSAGTDPNDVRSTLRVFDFHLNGGTAAFSFTSLLGNHYAFESRDDLATGSWTSLNNNVWGQTDSTLLMDTNAAAHAQRFYRVRALPWSVMRRLTLRHHGIESAWKGTVGNECWGPSWINARGRSERTKCG